MRIEKRIRNEYTGWRWTKWREAPCGEGVRRFLRTKNLYDRVELRTISGGKSQFRRVR